MRHAFGHAGTSCDNRDPVISFFLGNDSRRAAKAGPPRQKSSARAKRHGNRVLMVGSFRELALYRAEVLRQSGFAVSVPNTIEEAMRVMKRGDFDSVILSYTLPNSTVEKLAEHARDVCPDCPIIAITDTPVLDRLISPDAIALAHEGPPALLAALRKVLLHS
jgi:hypothetical protein